MNKVDSSETPALSLAVLRQIGRTAESGIMGEIAKTNTLTDRCIKKAGCSRKLSAELAFEVRPASEPVPI
jgi:hypothetical protein